MNSQTDKLGKTAITVEGVHKKTRAYDRLCIVMNSLDGVSYISRIPVPIGVEISNTKYWFPFFIGKNNLVLALTSGDSDLMAMTQKAVTEMYNMLSESVDERFAEQAETNNSLQSIGEEAQHYAELSQEASETYLAAIQELSPDQQAALQLAVTVGTHTRQIAALEAALGGTSIVHISESQYQTLSLTGELELTPAVMDGETVVTPAVVLAFDENATYMTYEEDETSESDSSTENS